MTAIQFCFTLRTSSTVRTVHLLGSWDNYKNQLPLSKDRLSSRSGSWTGNFRFKGNTLQPEKRYWYYYIIDGYQVSYNPQQCSVIEPITRRILNVLDIPFDGRSQTSAFKMSSTRNLTSTSGRQNSRHKSSLDKNILSSARRKNSKESLNLTVDIPKGRPLSMSKIKSPKPITPHATRFILEADYSSSSINEITSLFSASTIDKYQYRLSNSPSSSVDSSSSDRFDSDSPSSASSFSDYSSTSPASNSSCERYETTRRGERNKSDCDRIQHGYMDDLSMYCSSEDDIYIQSKLKSGNRCDILGEKMRR